MQTIGVLERPAPVIGAIRTDAEPVRLGNTVAILGLGYVGLPTSLGLVDAGWSVTGIDIDPNRLTNIRDRQVDLSPLDKARLGRALRRDSLNLTSRVEAMTAADAVIICVPTPVDGNLLPDLTILRAACESVVAHARPGQVLILTSTSYVGTTRELLVEPLEAKGLRVGRDIHVAFSPERIDPGSLGHDHADVPRVLGGVTVGCTRAARRVLDPITPMLHEVSSAEAAELTKLHENTFRAVNITLANELADACKAFGLDPIEVVDAAATKPYGFMPFYPSAGVGGHCIPCDPHYLLWQLRRQGVATPLIDEAMKGISARPHRMVDEALRVLDEADETLTRPKVLVVGAAYKPGVADVRESPALEIIDGLRGAGLDVDYHDSLIPTVRVEGGLTIRSVFCPDPDDYDLVMVVTMQPDTDHSWLARCRRVLDCTYNATFVHHRVTP